MPLAGANLSPVQNAFNNAMSKVHISVEWYFMVVPQLWGLMYWKKKMRVHEMPSGLIYRAPVPLTTMHNCVSPNQISQYFKCKHRRLEDYISARKGNTK